MKDDSFDCTLIAHLRIFLLFYRLLYCLILPENRLFFGIWKVVEIEFERLLLQAKEGNADAVLEILEIYKPLLIKNAIVNGRFDEDLYQELVSELLQCIQRFRIIE